MGALLAIELCRGGLSSPFYTLALLVPACAIAGRLSIYAIRIVEIPWLLVVWLCVDWRVGHRSLRWLCWLRWREHAAKTLTQARCDQKKLFSIDVHA